MSHFTVLVQTQTDDWSELEAALQPFHEFEITGIDDQYVAEIDDTDNLRKTFAASSSCQSFAEWAAEWTGRHIFRDGKPVSGDDDGKYGRIVVDDTGEVVLCIDRTIPEGADA